MPANIEITTEQLKIIKNLFDQKFGSRKISKILGISRDLVQKGYKQLGIYNIGRQAPRLIDFDKIIELVCARCKKNKNVDFFRKRIRNKNGNIRRSYECYCLNCEQYFANESGKKRSKLLRKTDANFILRKSLSYFIWDGLKNNHSSKNGKSCLDFIEYTMQDLKINIESKFESWMSWKNYGAYKKSEWNDADQSTWKWQLDHIMPQSDLPYTSMEDDNFKKCWSLDNLRPYSAKQNNLDGTNKIRHKKLL